MGMSLPMAWETERLVTWCNSDNLVLNTQRTVEIILNFRKQKPCLPLLLDP